MTHRRIGRDFSPHSNTNSLWQKRAEGIIFNFMNIHNVERKTAEVAETLKSIAHPKRLLLLCHMVSGEQTVGELARRLDWRESSVSQALMGLRREGIVSGRRDGQHIHYTLARDDIRQLLNFLYLTYCNDGPDHD